MSFSQTLPVRYGISQQLFPLSGRSSEPCFDRKHSTVSGWYVETVLTFQSQVHASVLLQENTYLLIAQHKGWCTNFIPIYRSAWYSFLCSSVVQAILTVIFVITL